ncbi:MAG: SCO family protein [Sulfuriferula sp.]
MSNVSPPENKISRIKLLLLFALFALPVMVSYVAYYFWTPSGKTSNYGELLPVKMLTGVTGVQADGAPFSLEQLKGKWVMVEFDSGKCDEYCREKLYTLRQVRMAQGAERDRVQRLWLITDNVVPAAELMTDYAGTIVATTGQSVREKFPANGHIENYIYLVDPLGNLMLRFPKNPNPSGMIKDIKHLLKTSQIG